MKLYSLIDENNYVEIFTTFKKLSEYISTIYKPLYIKDSYENEYIKWTIKNLKEELKSNSIIDFYNTPNDCEWVLRIRRHNM